jgi:hypothetical protein
VISEEQYQEMLARMWPKAVSVAAANAPTDSPRESLIEAECTKILEEDGWRALRTDPVSDRSKGKGFGEVGMADHLYMRYLHAARIKIPTGYAVLKAPACEVLWIEFKRPGKKAKKHQTEWHIKERARGALTLIAGEDFPATVAGFREWYRDSGLQRAGGRS